MRRLTIALALLGWIPPAARAHGQEPLFVPGSPVTVGRGSGEVLLADLDRDGHLDLLTRHLLDRSIAVRRGDGTGRFAPTASSTMRFDFQPGAATLGDVDADGILDLAVARKDEEHEYVHIFRGDGTGGFDQARGATVVASAAHKYYKPRVQLVDVNEDGTLDIVTANGQRNTLEILFGDGRGAFSAATVVELGSGPGLYSSAIADVDGDGHLDLVAATSGWSGSGPGRVATKRGDGRGGFTDVSGSAVTVLAAPRLIALADVNGDRRADIVIGHSRTNLLSILLSGGNGGFTPLPGSPLDLGMEAWAADVADVDRDGQRDLVVATVNTSAAPYDSRIAVVRGDGRGFVPAPGSTFPAGRGGYHLALGDVDEDGALDIAASSFEGDAVTLLLGRRSPAPGQPAPAESPLAQYPGFGHDHQADEARFRRQEVAREQAIAGCMRRAGFAYTPSPSVVNPGADGARVTLPARPNSNERYASSLGAAVRTRYYLALYGVPDPNDEENLWDPRSPTGGGCSGEAMREIPSVYAAKSELMQPYRAMVRAVAQDGRVQAAEQRWAECMRARGYRYASPRALYGEVDRAAVQGPPPGRSMAEVQKRNQGARAANPACNASAALDSTIDAVRAEKESEFVRAHRVVLDRHRARQRSQVLPPE